MSDFQLPPEIIGLEEYTEHINLMVYGDSGIGKTVFAGSANTLILATEQGTVSAARQGSEAKMADCTTLEKMDRMMDWLDDATLDPDFPFDWVAVDTATELQSIMLRDVVDRRVEEGTAKSLNPYKVELQEYGEMHEMFRTYVRRINRMPVNTCWTAQAMLTQDEEGNEFRMPMFQGKGNQMAMWMASKMHAYGYMHNATVAVKNKETNKVRNVQRRRIQWQSSETARAKDRFDALGQFTTGKSLADITTMIHTNAAAA